MLLRLKYKWAFENTTGEGPSLKSRLLSPVRAFLLPQKGTLLAALQHQSRRAAAAIADGGDPQGLVLVLEAVDEVADDAPPRHANGMTQGHRPTEHVHVGLNGEKPIFKNEGCIENYFFLAMPRHKIE